MSFFRKNKEKIILAVVLLALIVLIGVTSSERLALSRLEKTFGNILTPIGKVSNSIGKNISDFFGGFKEITSLKTDNKELREKIIQLEDENRKQLDVIGKTDYLKNEYNLLKETKFKLIEAQIVGKEPGNWFDRFTIDKGLKDGIKKGDIVIQGIEVEQRQNCEGLIGRIIDVGDNWAKVVTIVDELTSISFKVLRTQDQGIVSGSGRVDSKITGYLFDEKADVIKGDKLYTSGLGGSFVKDLYIGEISNVIDEDEDMLRTIEVEPAINFKKLYRIYIISD